MGRVLLSPRIYSTPLKKYPEMPRRLGINERRILAVAKKEKALISGSLSQRILVKGSRKHKDIDLIVDNVSQFAKKVKAVLGNDVTIVSKKITSKGGNYYIKRIYSKEGKLIADIDPMSRAEEGMVKSNKNIKVSGYYLLNPKTRLASKIAQLSKEKKNNEKVLKDINILTGYKPKKVRQMIGKPYPAKKLLLLHKKSLSTLKIQKGGWW